MGSQAPPVVRKRLVDDADQSIRYGGTRAWSVVGSSTLTAGNFGAVYGGSSHKTTENATMSFSFNGTSMEVWGTLAVKSVANVTDPTWDCLIDGIKIPYGGNESFPFPENNYPLCTQDAIVPGPHTLEIRVYSAGTPFFLDYLTYLPLPEDTFDSAVLLYNGTDPAVSYTDGWDTFGGENATDVHGAQVRVDFHGTSASMYGFVPNERPHNATWATYKVDQAKPVNFTLNGLSSDETQYNVLMFATPPLENTQHSLVVTYGGDNQHTPLVLQNFYVTNVSEPFFNLSSSTSASSSATSKPSARSHTPVGAIAGGVVAGVLVLIAIASFLLWRRRRRKAMEVPSTLPRPFLMGMTESDPSRPPRVFVSENRPAAQRRPFSGSSYPLSSTDYPSVIYADSRGPRSDVSRPLSSSDYPSILESRVAASRYADTLDDSSPLHHHPSSDIMSSRYGASAVSVSSVPPRETSSLAVNNSHTDIPTRSLNIPP
ncbi:Peroxidase [Mycena chlorophos]|uniref:Peroxidase n=1 Tax=Mycena chlorophos TaxID=658473 RepID=A0A8H6TDV3_MYCCL|nr:Peroxidase [Mycena chlorophos]